MAGRFLHFPLSLLSLDRTEEEILHVVLCYSTLYAGEHRPAPASKEGKALEGKLFTACKEWPFEVRFDPLDPEHLAYGLGGIVLGLTPHDIPHELKLAREAKAFVTQFQEKHGPDAPVYISLQLFEKCRAGRSLNFRQFSTLCAINSVMGLKRSSPMLIRRPMIIARQMGYKTPSVQEQELEAETARPRAQARRPLSVQQLRDTLDQLETMDLLSRFHASRRNVYFSTTLGYEKLREACVANAQKLSLVRQRRAEEAFLARMNRVAKEGAEPVGEPQTTMKASQVEPLRASQLPPHGAPKREPLKEMVKEMSFTEMKKEKKKEMDDQQIREGEASQDSISCTEEDRDKDQDGERSGAEPKDQSESRTAKLSLPEEGREGYEAGVERMPPAVVPPPPPACAPSVSSPPLVPASGPPASSRPVPGSGFEFGFGPPPQDKPAPPRGPAERYLALRKKLVSLEKSLAATLELQKDAAPFVRVSYKRRAQAEIDAVKAQISELVHTAAAGTAKKGGWEKGF